MLAELIKELGLLPEIPDSIMEMHNAIEDVVSNEDEFTLHGETYILVPADELYRLSRIHRKLQEIHNMIHSR